MNFSAITANTHAQLKQAMSLSLLNMAKNNATVSATAMIEDLKQATHPTLGKSLDIKV